MFGLKNKVLFILLFQNFFCYQSILYCSICCNGFCRFTSNSMRLFCADAAEVSIKKIPEIKNILVRSINAEIKLKCSLRCKITLGCANNLSSDFI